MVIVAVRGLVTVVAGGGEGVGVVAGALGAVELATGEGAALVGVGAGEVAAWVSDGLGEPFPVGVVAQPVTVSTAATSRTTACWTRSVAMATSSTRSDY